MAAVESSDEDIRRVFRKGQAKACVKKGHAVSPRRGFTQAVNLRIVINSELVPITPSLTEDKKWCIYMKYHHEELAEPLIRELCSKEEGIMFAEKALTKVDRDYAKAIRNMNIIKNEYERGVRLEAARKEGLAEGLAEGLEKGLAEGLAEGREKGLAEGLAEGLEKGHTKEKLEIALKMKKAGRPFDEIAEFTELPMKTIEEL